MSSFHLAIKDKHGTWQHHKVPEAVYVYVRQLENRGRKIAKVYWPANTDKYDCELTRHRTEEN